MPRRRTVQSLRRLGLTAAAALSRQVIHRTVDRVVLSDSVLEAETRVTAVDEKELQRCVTAAHDLLFEGVPQWLGEELVPLWWQVLGVEVRRRSHPTDNNSSSPFKAFHEDDIDSIHPRMSMELTDTAYVLLRLTEAAVWTRLTRLDLPKVSKQLRTFLYNHLSGFRSLRMLDLGPGTGGWLSESFLDGFYGAGLRAQSRLVVFRLHHDCTNGLVEALFAGCGDTLRVVDVRYSRFVDDGVLESVLGKGRKDLVELGVAGTAITTAGCARLISHFAHLQRFLVDNLHEVLQHITENNATKLPTFNITDFRPDSSDTNIMTPSLFYENYNMELLSATCPRIARVSLGATTAHELNFGLLPRFTALQVLTLSGGMYDRTTMSLLSGVPSLRTLDLNHVEMVSYSALEELLSTVCSGLTTLSLKNCHLLSENVLSPLSPGLKTSLTRLVIHSRCEHNFLFCILRLVTHIQDLHLGISTDVSDGLLGRLLRAHPDALRMLQMFSVAHSDQLGMLGVFQLVNHCPGLRSVQDLEALSRVSVEEVEGLNVWAREHNLVLRTTPGSGAGKSASAGSIASLVAEA